MQAPQAIETGKQARLTLCAARSQGKPPSHKGEAGAARQHRQVWRDSNTASVACFCVLVVRTRMKWERKIGIG